MCQVHTGAYVSLVAPGKTDYTACHQRKTTTYILHIGTYHYAYARQTQVNWKKYTKREQVKGKERKGMKRKRKRKEKKRKDKKSKKRQDKKRKQGKEKRKDIILADPRN